MLRNKGPLPKNRDYCWRTCMDFCLGNETEIDTAATQTTLRWKCDTFLPLYNCRKPRQRRRTHSRPPVYGGVTDRPGTWDVVLRKRSTVGGRVNRGAMTPDRRQLLALQTCRGCGRGSAEMSHGTPNPADVLTKSIAKSPASRVVAVYVCFFFCFVLRFCSGTCMSCSQSCLIP